MIPDPYSIIKDPDPEDFTRHYCTEHVFLPLAKQIDYR
jgi:hypothetical protein